MSGRHHTCRSCQRMHHFHITSGLHSRLVLHHLASQIYFRWAARPLFQSLRNHAQDGPVAGVSGHGVDVAQAGLPEAGLHVEHVVLVAPRLRALHQRRYSLGQVLDGFGLGVVVTDHQHAAGPQHADCLLHHGCDGLRDAFMHHKLTRHHVLRCGRQPRILHQGVGVLYSAGGGSSLLTLPFSELSHGQEVRGGVQAQDGGVRKGLPEVVGGGAHAAANVQYIPRLPRPLLLPEVLQGRHEAATHPLPRLHHWKCLLRLPSIHICHLSGRLHLESCHPVEVPLLVRMELLEVVVGVADAGELHLPLQLLQHRQLSLELCNVLVPSNAPQAGCLLQVVLRCDFHSRKQRLAVDHAVHELCLPSTASPGWAQELALCGSRCRLGNGASGRGDARTPPCVPPECATAGAELRSRLLQQRGALHSAAVHNSVQTEQGQLLST
mmetsp:Transcript_5164/g.14838  ORF Transcript_5164/g.14838 Transcript_5164/m.14838 type:complete len:438 (+) Transcript_5164:345-1658(+)